MKHKGLPVILSAPSGCGKDTVYHELLKRRDDIVESVSATTRPRRDGEVNGVNYYFLTNNEFKALIEEGGLLEYAEYNGHLYGTPVESVKRAIDAGKICLLIIDVQGAEEIMKQFDDCISIFLLPPSIDVLEERLKQRNTDDSEIILQRLAIAKRELAAQDMYQYKIVNDNLDDCVDKIDKILCDELAKRNAQ